MNFLPTRTTIQWIGLFAGPIAALITYATLPETYVDPTGEVIAFTEAGRATAAVGVWMAIWWLTEAIHISATALLPIALLPLFGARTIEEATAPYANNLIFLFMGGFMISLAMQRWNLHKRIALLTLRMVGTNPHMTVAGFMLATAVLSMWVSNTATTIMMLPIALSVIATTFSQVADRELPEPGRQLPDIAGKNFALCLMLGIAYAASIGGVGTIIGTPPNLILVSYIRETMGIEISFFQWLLIGLPIVVIFLPLAWLLLTRVLYPIRVDRTFEGEDVIASEYAKLGPMSRGERATLVVFSCTALAWITRPLLSEIEIAGVAPLAGLTDAGIAIIAGIALFVIPVNVKEREFVMSWDMMKNLPWGILILFGGGLSLAASVEATGVGEFLGHQVEGLRGVSVLMLVLLVAAMVVFLTELTSNTATTATLVPILAGIAPGLGIDPLMLIVPIALAASMAFMMPVATPPNAIVFGSGYITIPQMVRAGFWLNLVSIMIVTAAMFSIVVPLLGIEPVVP